MKTTEEGVSAPVLPMGAGWALPAPHKFIDVRRRLGDVALLAVAALIVVAALVLKSYNIRWFWYSPWLHLYSLVVTGYIFSRAVLAFFYREPEERGYLPTVSVVIAVKNEEAHIADTIEHCFQAQYPSDRLEVIVVDDGSTDRTWELLSELCRRYPSLRPFRFPENRGKREAMALGAQKGQGEILVYVDSDSLIKPDGIRRIVQPFDDPQVGAVAGNVEVWVDPSNIISKMESVRYFISHRFMKAAESVFGVVSCCSGAFSAYRRDVVLKVLPKWLNQTFLGTKATFGDDRSLTNFVLRTHRVIFHNGARCKTFIPENWSKYFRQQLRWKKSWSRETLVASRILYKKHPIAALSYYTGVVLTLVAPMMVLRNVVYLPLFSAQSSLPYLGGLLLIYLFFCVFHYYFTRERHWYCGLTFAVLYISVLAWQNYYAIATVRRSHWGTR